MEKDNIKTECGPVDLWMGNPTNITLRIETYEDIFSDFDPRSYSQKALSDDLLIELKRASRDKDDNVSLNFLIDEKKRNIQDEAVIKKRLQEHFGKHRKQLEKQVKKPIVDRGIKFVVTGIALMFAATYLDFTEFATSMFHSFFIFLLQPASWFFLWEGFAMVLFEAKKINPDLEFYKKMAGSKISFNSLWTPSPRQST